MKRLSVFLCGVYFLFVQVATGQPTDPKKIDYYYFKEGMSLRADGKDEEALASFRIFLGHYPDYAKAYYYRGYSFMHLKRYEEALTDFLALQKLEPRNPDAPFGAGEAAYALGRYDEAIAYYNQAIEIAPNTAAYFNNRGVSQCMKKEFNSGLSDFRKAIKLDTTFAYAYLNAGAARYFNQNLATPTKADLRQAYDYFTQAIYYDPYLSLARRNRAVMSYFLTEYDNALDDLHIAYTLNNLDPNLYFYSGIIYKTQKNYTEAISNFEKALKLNPQHNFAMEEIGNVHKESGRYDKAIEYYREAARVNPEMGDQYKGLMEYKVAAVYALNKQKELMYVALDRAKDFKLFQNLKCYQEFIRSDDFAFYRYDEPMKKFRKGIGKITKQSDFLNDNLLWYTMQIEMQTLDDK